MNETASKFEWDGQIRSWRNYYNPIAMRDISVWEYRLQQGLNRLPYLSKLSKIKSEDNEYDLQLHVQLKDVGSNQDLVQKDFRTIFKSILGERKCLYTIQETSEGFDFVFGTLDNDECVFIGKLRTIIP